MKHKKTFSAVLFIYFFSISHLCFGWGFFAHKLINKTAVFSLPTPLFQFYKDNIFYITESAVNPDKRRCIIENEAEKHFIDLDNYSKEEQKNMPKKWFDAISKYSEKNLREHGISPWNIIFMKKKLIDAMKKGDAKQILKLSAEVGHYIADANVPLHTTKNYNGQLTDQNGIHGFWESRLPELFSDKYDLFVGTAKKIYSLEDRVWEAINSANNCLEKIFENEKKLSEKFKNKKYGYEKRGSVLQKVYSYKFSKAFHDSINGMVEEQMRKSIKMVADFWYTCWVEAGMPNLNSLEKNLCKTLSEEEKKEISEAKKISKKFRDCE